MGATPRRPAPPEDRPAPPRDRAEHAREGAALTGEGFDAGVRTVQGMHDAIAARAFDGVGPIGSGVRQVHDTVTASVYSAVRGGGRLASRGLGAWAAGRAGALPGVREQMLVSAVNGAWGDTLERRASPWALTAGWRREGDDLPAEPAALAAAFPQAGPHLVVLVHGLLENEHSWRSAPPSAPDGPVRGFDRLLARDLGVDTLVLRYNSGRHISHNGADVAALLAATVAAWPVPVTRLSLVGHSMGGLVLRSAMHQADGSDWVARVRDLITLGTPHRGAPLEKAVNLGGWLMRKFPEAAPLATALESRSAGVKDLRHGYLLDSDWTDVDPDLLLRDTGTEVPLPTRVRLHVVSTVLTRDPRHPVARLLGDLLVLEGSAAGTATRSRRVPLTPTTTHRLTGRHHFELMHDPAVYDVIMTILREAVPAPAVPTAVTPPLDGTPSR